MTLVSGFSHSSNSHSSLDTVDLKMNKSHEAVVLGQGTFGKVCNCHLTVRGLGFGPCTASQGLPSPI